MGSVLLQYDLCISSIRILYLFNDEHGTEMLSIRLLNSNRESEKLKDTEESFPNHILIKLKYDCIYHILIDFKPNEIPFGFKSI